jgi:hypothetical protein
MTSLFYEYDVNFLYALHCLDLTACISLRWWFSAVVQFKFFISTLKLYQSPIFNELPFKCLQQWRKTRNCWKYAL